MKIISKYKDYYDYLQGIYGVDDKLILDRTEGTTKLCFSENNEYVLVICGKIIEFYYSDNKCHFNEDIAKFHSADRMKRLSYNKSEKPVYYISNPYRDIKIYYPTLSEDTKNIYPELKKLYKKSPIFIYDSYREGIRDNFPSLLELGVNKEIDAKTIWILLSDWLGKNKTNSEPSVPVGDDKTRIVSSGFDLKTSFRNIK